jgi:diguanylate cyclase (GGDEF)-like protein
MLDQALVWNTDAALQVTSLTARLRGFAGIGHGTPRLHVSDLWAGRDPFPLVAHQGALGGETFAFEAVVRGTRLAFEIAPLLDPSGAIAGVTGRATELPAIARRPEHSERAAFEARLHASLARSERDDSHGAVICIGLDGFKAIDEAHGHGYGDAVLRAVEDRLTRHTRASDTLARLGRDEFVLLIDDLFTDEAAVHAARKILRGLDEPLRIGDDTLRVCASIGIATYPGVNVSLPALLTAAECEMQAVKRNGGYGIKLASACQTRSSPALPPFATLESA